MPKICRDYDNEKRLPAEKAGTKNMTCGPVLIMFFRIEVIRGSLMGMPLIWHRRHALAIAGQLPENTADALLVLQAVRELVDTFLSKSPDAEGPRAANVLPFNTAG